MKELTLDFIVHSCQGEKLGTSNPIINKIATDSRQEMNSHTLFIALKGENHDGHKFIQDAFNKGACAAIVSDKNTLDIDKLENKSIIVVDDTLSALQRIAKSYRQQFAIPIVAITGSVGKTTTKEILSSLLNGTFNTLYTEGNFNNDIGLPLTIFRMEEYHEAAVVEVAMRARGEISRLVDIARPSCAIITNVEPVHLETLGSIENIAKAKCEVLETLTNEDFAIINGDNDLLIEIANT
ncbi:MAG: UDP-N-acetylmuramoyl-tripeptide--D-alanyl-D-alanine ligase, partial [Syntrophomonadaceae bacterium]|nr:UDP-N-acetylmuramoyl-tripeptide--D-alanyl-D-alanine ligase [Syntrophomonadaceae bacterium]